MQYIINNLFGDMKIDSESSLAEKTTVSSNKLNKFKRKTSSELVFKETSLVER